MGLEDRDYMQERAKDRQKEESYGNVRDEDEKVRQAYYQPKSFRRLRVRFPRWPTDAELAKEGASPQETSQKKSSGGLGFGTLYATFLLGTAIGFLLACLLGILEFRLFEWGVVLMRPIARFFAGL